MPTSTRYLSTRTRLAAAVALGLGATLALSGTAIAAPGPSDQDSITLNLDTAALEPQTLTGWKGTARADTEVIGGALRFSNSISSPFNDSLKTPALAVSAGEAGVGDVNTFDTTFTVASATGAVQEGVNVEVALDNTAGGFGRHGGLVSLYHKDGKLKIGTFRIADTVPLSNPVNTSYEWVETVIAEVDPAVAHTIRIVARFVDGPNNDIVDFYVDGQLSFTTTSWERLAEVKQIPLTTGNDVARLTFSAGKSTASVDGLPVFGNIPVNSAFLNMGLLFSDISYSSYNILPVPPVTTLPELIAPAPEPAPNGDLDLPPATDLGNFVDVVGTGFEPFELVHFTWYSTPTFAGWAQADAFGVVRARFVVPAALQPGSTHTLQAVGARSGWVVNARTTIALAATGAETAVPLALMAGSLLLVGAGALALVGLQRRRTA